MADSLNTLSLPENRPDLEALIEAAIARLDEIEPDPDLEPDDDGEPQLGAPEARAGSWNGLYPVAFTDDREADDSDLEDGGDDEPALASTVMQDRFNRHTMQDNDLEKDDADSEPSLASRSVTDQRGWTIGSNDDLEEACEDEGAQCDDEGYDDDREPGDNAELEWACWPTQCPELVTLGRSKQAVQS